MRALTFVLFIGVFTVFGCQQAGSSDTIPAAADVETCQQYIEDGAGLVDVRTPEEWNAGHLKGATHINLYDPDFEQRFAALDTSKIYVVYCRSGNRSGQAIEKMKPHGFSKLINMQGGIKAWTAKEFPVVTE